MAEELREVVVTDVRIPFFSLVVLSIKLVLASIPAVFILWVLGMGGMMMFWNLMDALMDATW